MGLGIGQKGNIGLCAISIEADLNLAKDGSY